MSKILMRLIWGFGSLIVFRVSVDETFLLKNNVGSCEMKSRTN
jgi:hypothetical protein